MKTSQKYKKENAFGKALLTKFLKIDSLLKDILSYHLA